MTDLEFESTVKRYISMLYRVAFNYLKNKEDSEDSVQNVFIRLYHCRKNFKSEEHIKAWLIRVTINESKRILSNNKKHSTIDIEKVANELYSDETEQRDFSIELMKLNPTYSTVMLSKTTASVNMILSRARKQLKERLKEDNDE